MPQQTQPFKLLQMLVDRLDRTDNLKLQKRCELQEVGELERVAILERSGPSKHGQIPTSSDMASWSINISFPYVVRIFSGFIIL
jgi:hypothetical protein